MAFFCSYILVVGVVLMNVVVAVLVDAFQQTVKKQEEEERELVKAQTRSGMRPALEGLMRKLIHFRNEAQLEGSIRQIFEVSLLL